MDKILLSGGLSFIISFFSIPVIIQVAKDKKLFDEPDERKVHKNVIPTLGGVGIFAGFIIATLLGVPLGSTEIQYYIAATVVVFFLGLKDDILILSASKKFAGQVIAAGILIQFGGVNLNDMHGLFGIHHIPAAASFALTMLTIIMITNSFNLIDGVDGLAGSLGILTTAVFGSYFAYVGQFTYAIMAFSLTGSLVSFLIYNFPPAKIFMGDTGSLLVGLVNSILVIKFINIASASNAQFPVTAAPAIGFAVLMIPLFDTLRVFGMRILSRRSPFSPDRNHIHHFLLDTGLCHRNTTFVCIAANIFFIAIAVVCRNVGTSFLLMILFSLGMASTGIVYNIRQRKLKASKRNNTLPQKAELIKSHKILSLASDAVEVD